MEKIRLDKFLSNAKVLSRKETVTALKRQEITINDQIATKKEQLVSTEDIVKYKGNIVSYEKYIYIMLNKPNGYVSSTDDPRDKTVLDLLPSNYRKYDLFPCGRLDKDTVGLVILTNNGIATHKLLSPKNHVEKTYYFELAEPITSDKIKAIEDGILLADGYVTKPCRINMATDTSGHITLTEGKYHEIKRMFGASSNKITYLKRISFDKILLDPNLKEGEYRLLNDQEKQVFEQFES